MDQARNVTATFTPTAGPHTLTVKLAGIGHGRADSTPAGIACGSDCVETYTDGQVVTLVATATKKSAFKGFTGCDTVVGNTCTVTLDADRLVVVTFDPNPWLNLRIPSRLVLHSPYDRARVKVYAERNGKPLKGVKVRITVRCPGRPLSRHHGVTNRKGVMRFTEARDMPNALRVLKCRVFAKATMGHRKVYGRGRIRFIHPYWLNVASQSADGRHVVINAFARPGWTFYAYVNSKRIVKAKTHKNGWVRISLPTAGPGDLVWLSGINRHLFSHVLTLGRTPGTAKVEPDRPHH